MIFLTFLFLFYCTLIVSLTLSLTVLSAYFNVISISFASFVSRYCCASNSAISILRCRFLFPSRFHFRVVIHYHSISQSFPPFALSSSSRRFLSHPSLLRVSLSSLSLFCPTFVWRVFNNSHETLPSFVFSYFNSSLKT